MSIDLDINMLKAYGNSPRVHPNGFIQLDFPEPGRRLHIWPKEILGLGQDSESPIHDHIFAMQSTIMRGSLTQLRYQLDLNHGGRPTHEIFMASYLKQSESVLKPTGVMGILLHDVTHHEALVEGEIYYQPPFTFHDTQPGRTPLVTIMQKSMIHDEHNPRVLVPVGEDVDNEFKRDKYSDELLWMIIDESIK